MNTLLQGHWKYLVLWVFITASWWAFAFFPLNTVDPEWLARAREVCFGMNDNGLPNAGGWILLVLGPIGLLLALIAIMGSEIKEELQDFNFGVTRKKMLFGLMVLLFAQITWASKKIVAVSDQSKVLNSYQVLDSVGGLPANYARMSTPAPDFKLIDQHGRIQGLENYSGKVTLVVFAFAHCSSVCPGLVHVANSALESITHPNMRAIFITLDPERDTPSSLPGLAQRWKLKPNSVVLSGSVADVHRVLDEFKVPHIKDEKTGEVTHPAIVTMIDQNGKLAYYFNNPSKQWIVDAANMLLAE